MEQSRRGFLSDVGKGMLVASVGTALATELGVSPALAESGRETITFGALEPLVDLMQESPVDKLLPALVSRIHAGTDLRQMVAAGALANARAFGGEDYIGFHTFMALIPAYEMSKELPTDRKALPILKVLYRNSNQIQKMGGRANEVLHPIDGHAESAANLRDIVHKLDVDRAEQAFADAARKSPKEAFDTLLPIVEDDADVHRTVLAYRAYTMMGITGKEHAHTLLRQSVRYCVKTEKGMVQNGHPLPAIRTALPKLLDQYKLLSRGFGSRTADDAWLDRTSVELIKASPEQAAEIVAAALAEGFSAQTIGECLALGANQQLLRDPGRKTAYPGKPVGSVHGDSYGVHASDSMNAWRNIVTVCNYPNAVAALIVGGYHLSRGGMGEENHWSKPFDPRTEEMKAIPADSLLRQAESAIREQNQARAAAIVNRYGELGMPSRPVFDLLLKYATSEDGALHAEKYYRTVTEEFHRSRPAFRWRQLVALARVTASEYGKRADGYEEACRLLGVGDTQITRG